jgi:hypothetical protein
MKQAYWTKSQAKSGFMVFGWQESGIRNIAANNAP